MLSCSTREFWTSHVRRDDAQRFWSIGGRGFLLDSSKASLSGAIRGKRSAALRAYINKFGKGWQDFVPNVH